MTFSLTLMACNPLEPALVRDAKEAVSYKMKDPLSVQFRNVELCAKPNAVRGEVNSKNSYGAFAGFETFYYVDGQATLFSDEYADLDSLMKACFSDEVNAAVDKQMKENEM